MSGVIENPTYEVALKCLNSTQTPHDKLEKRRKRKRDGEELTSPADQMREWWIPRLGLYSIEDLNRLNIVHVTGSKGKSLTCAFVSSILQRYSGVDGKPLKIGLFTSPHLLDVRERICMNGEPISEEKFTKYFFEVWNKVESTAEKKHPKSPRRPQYFRFLTLLSYYIFLKERVDIVIYEVGIGGERDGTNILEQPAVTGVSSLEIHHVDALGDTLESVAAIKAGIFRKGCPAFTVEQDPEAFESLERRADDKDVHLATVATHPGLKDVSIKPAECFQFKNASLAIALAEVALKKVGVSVDHVEGLPEQFIQGLETLAWRGTREVLIRDQLQWHLDVADTKKSLMGASSWFANIPNENKLPRVLIFNNQAKGKGLDLPVELLKYVHHTACKLSFQYAVFCVPTRKGFDDRNPYPEGGKNLELEERLAAEWRRLDPETKVETCHLIEEAIGYVKKTSDKVGGMQILVTGSSTLVGGAISILEAPEDTTGIVGTGPSTSVSDL